LDNTEKIREEIRQIRAAEESAEAIERKLDDLILLLEKSKLNSDQVKKLQHKFNSALEETRVNLKDIEQFKELDDSGATREELVVNLEAFLLNHEVDSTLPGKIQFAERVKQVSKVCISLLMITLGYGMIILPAPPNFEMFTVFYFNLNDGVTLMDLISLLVVFTGIYLLITSFIKQRRYN
jgi:hypothetical protein